MAHLARGNLHLFNVFAHVAHLLLRILVEVVIADKLNQSCVTLEGEVEAEVVSKFIEAVVLVTGVTGLSLFPT